MANDKSMDLRVALLEHEMGNSVLTVVLSCTALQFAVQYAMLRLYVHAH